MVSDSAKFNITSRKEGTEPVVIAFTRGIVIVGDVAWAVKGMAAPERINLAEKVSILPEFFGARYELLSESKA